MLVLALVGAVWCLGEAFPLRARKHLTSDGQKANGYKSAAEAASLENLSLKS